MVARGAVQDGRPAGPLLDQRAHGQRAHARPGHGVGGHTEGVDGQRAERFELRQHRLRVGTGRWHHLDAGEEPTRLWIKARGLGGTASGRRRPGPGRHQDARASARIWSTCWLWFLGWTLGKTLMSVPTSSMTNVERIMPM